MSAVRIWWATGLGLVALFLALAYWDPATAGGPDFCLFHRTTGVACPGCGLTRAAAALARGRFAESWHWHPLFAVLAVEVAALWLLRGAAVQRARRQRSLAAGVAFQTLVPRVAIGTGVLLLVVWIVRFSAGTLPV